MEQPDTSNRLIAVAILAAVLMNFPLLGIFSNGGVVWGVPGLYLYLVISWLVVIAMTAWVVERRRKSNSKT